MKHIITSLLVLPLIFSACAIPRQAELPATQLELINMTPLPPIKFPSFAGGLKLNVLLHVMQDGTVETVRMLGSSGDADWDSLALQVMKQWRYAIPRRDGVPVDAWFRQLVVVQIQEPIEMTIGELATSSLHEADSLYSLLEKHADLDTLFRHAFGTVNIMAYPQQVREKLKKLDENEFTAPLRVGEEYVIYKRFSRSAAKDRPR